MFARPFNRLTAFLSSAALVSVLALPAPAMADNDTLRKLLLLGVAAVVVKTVIDNQNRSNTRSAPFYTNPGYSRADVSDVQYDLRRAGFYNGRIDGVWGQQTRKAVLDFQRAHGYTANGILTQVQLDRLNRLSSRGSLSSSGRHVSTTPLPDRSYYGNTILNRSQLRGLQSDLQFLGHYSGPIDGVWGRHSQAALERFRLNQRNHGGVDLHAQPGVMDLASVAVSARRMEEDISRDLDQRLSRSAY